MGVRADLDAAYRATAYTAGTPRGTLTLRVGEPSPALDALLASEGATSWAFITAYNPGSVLRPAAENEARQRDLRAAVEALGYTFYEGQGIGAGWPPEASLLIPGVSEDQAAALGRRFGQAAIVVGQMGGTPRLLWL